MGFFNFLKGATTPPRTQHTANQKERTRKDALSKAYFDDTHTKQLERKYYTMLQKLEDRYKELNNAGSFAGRPGSNLISLCQDTAALFLELVPLWQKYEEPIPRCPAFSRQAMIHEKREEYEKAAAVCVVAIRAGFPDDGTKGGMPARLKRMIKKGNLHLSEDVMDLIS